MGNQLTPNLDDCLCEGHAKVVDALISWKEGLEYVQGFDEFASDLLSGRTDMVALIINRRDRFFFRNRFDGNVSTFVKVCLECSKPELFQFRDGNRLSTILKC